jgi:hypothetical protein
MKMKKIAIILAVLIAAGAIATAVAATENTLTWEKTFTVTSPQIAANIKIGEPRIVGYPVNIMVSLRLKVPGLPNQCKDHDDKDDHPAPAQMSNITVNGTYAANLLMLNTTSSMWQQFKTLQAPTNVTLTVNWYTNSYVFTPTETGQYKVQVTFTTANGTQTFTSQD